MKSKKHRKLKERIFSSVAIRKACDRFDELLLKKDKKLMKKIQHMRDNPDKEGGSLVREFLHLYPIAS